MLLAIGYSNISLNPRPRSGILRHCGTVPQWDFKTMSADKKTGGLAGVVAGQTSICTVGKEGMGLTYRGYSINDLAEKAAFEEVAYLLLYGALPNQEQLSSYRKKLAG